MKIPMQEILRTLASAAMLLGSSLQAQIGGDAALTGLVADQSGAAVAGATITAINEDTGVRTTQKASDKGEYVIYALKPGHYTVDVNAIHFDRLVQESIVIHPLEKTDFRITLKTGDKKLTVTFTDPPQIEMLGEKETKPAKHFPSISQIISTGTARIENGLYDDASFGGKPAPSQSLTPNALALPAAASAAVPLFRDPIHDGAADPVVIWNRAKKTWWMLYTNRRADLAGSGVEWVHGTRIGIAESADGGAHWHYLSEADIPYGTPDYTFWAPEVIYTGGQYHMFLTIVEGTFSDWNHPRHILHLTSKDLLHWKPLAYVNLPSERTIDACVFKLNDGTWRLWYKNEAAGSRIWASDSKDLVHWTPHGVAIQNNSGEGPIVFQWRGAYWMLEDTAPGLSAYRSTDLETWTRQPDKLLFVHGTQPTDRMEGKHPDVVIDGGGRAWLFYFTQQAGQDLDPAVTGSARRSVLHVTELHEASGILTADRNAPAYVHMLPPPQNKKSDMAGPW